MGYPSNSQGYRFFPTNGKIASTSTLVSWTNDNSFASLYQKNEFVGVFNYYRFTDYQSGILGFHSTQSLAAPYTWSISKKDGTYNAIIVNGTYKTAYWSQYNILFNKNISTTFLEKAAASGIFYRIPEFKGTITPGESIITNVYDSFQGEIRYGITQDEADTPTFWYDNSNYASLTASNVGTNYLWVKVIADYGYTSVSQYIAGTVTVENTSPLSVNIGGTWKRVQTASVNVNGAWKQVTDVKTNVNGTWK